MIQDLIFSSEEYKTKEYISMENIKYVKEKRAVIEIWWSDNHMMR